MRGCWTAKCAPRSNGNNEVHLNLWQVHVRHVQKESWATCLDFLLYAPVYFLVAILVANFPDATSVLKQEELIRQLVVEEQILSPVRDFAKSSSSVEGIPDIWAWAEHVLLGAIFTGNSTNNSVVDHTSRCIGARIGSNMDPQTPLAWGHNVLVGSLQVRQVRHGAWNVTQHFGHTAWCSPGNGCATARRPLGAETINSSWCEGRFACQYAPRIASSALKGSVLFTETVGGNSPYQVANYGKNGHAVDLPRNHLGARAFIHAMAAEEGGFVDRGTRLLAFTSNMYNVNDGHYTYLQVLFNIDATGHIDPYYRLQTIKPMDHLFYCDSEGMVGVLLAWLSWTCILVLLEINNLQNEGPRRYSQDMWNIFGLAMCCLSTFLVVQALLFKRHSDDLRHEIQIETRQRDPGWIQANDCRIPLLQAKFVDLDSLRGGLRDLQWALSLYCFVAIFHCFKYFRFLQRLNLMWRVMDLAAWQLLNFLTIIALLFVAFAVLAVSCFGYFMRTWHNVPTSLMTMIRMSMGEIGHGGYEDMKRAPGRTHSSTAPLFVMIYTLVFVVCLSNLFVAILTDMYYLARNELSVCRRFERCIKKELLCDEAAPHPECDYTLIDIMMEIFRIIRPQLSFTTATRVVPTVATEAGAQLRLQFSACRKAKAGPPALHTSRTEVYGQQHNVVADLCLNVRRTTERRTALYLSFLLPGDILILKEEGEVVRTSFQIAFIKKDNLTWVGAHSESAMHWVHHDKLALFHIQSCHCWQRWRENVPVCMPARTSLHIPFLLQIRLWFRSAFLFRSFNNGINFASCLPPRSSPWRLYHRRNQRLDQQLQDTVEEYLEVLCSQALESVPNPNNLVQVQAAFVHVVPMLDFQYRFFHWLETRYGTEYVLNFCQRHCERGDHIWTVALGLTSRL